jgi:ABC-type multidrug transport system ATPase subunit
MIYRISKNSVKRVTIIDHGKLLYDGKLDLLQERFGGKRQVIVDFMEEYDHVSIGGADIETTIRRIYEGRLLE